MLSERFSTCKEENQFWKWKSPLKKNETYLELKKKKEKRRKEQIKLNC